MSWHSTREDAMVVAQNHIKNLRETGFNTIANALESITETDRQLLREVLIEYRLVHQRAYRGMPPFTPGTALKVAEAIDAWDVIEGWEK